MAMYDQTGGNRTSARYHGRQRIRWEKTSAAYSSASAVHPVTT